MSIADMIVKTFKEPYGGFNCGSFYLLYYLGEIKDIGEFKYDLREITKKLAEAFWYLLFYNVVSNYYHYWVTYKIEDLKQKLSEVNIDYKTRIEIEMRIKVIEKSENQHVVEVRELLGKYPKGEITDMDRRVAKQISEAIYGDVAPKYMIHGMIDLFFDIVEEYGWATRPDIYKFFEVFERRLSTDYNTTKIILKATKNIMAKIHYDSVFASMIDVALQRDYVGDVVFVDSCWHLQHHMGSIITVIPKADAMVATLLDLKRKGELQTMWNELHRVATIFYEVFKDSEAEKVLRLLTRMRRYIFI
ncbi:MAG TPA: hypothetical protein ENG66_05955 [Thermococcus sp.]|nr:hypothetical protein [Thermococcus sp.]